jgi:putative restriction endonuclease
MRGTRLTVVSTALYLARRGQGRFRDDLWRIWGGCDLTRCRLSELVQAAHIKPWSESTDTERLDPHNGLLLLPTVHAALDAHLITFDPDDGELIMSDSLSSEGATAMGVHSDMRLSKIPEQTRSYLQHHANAFRAKARS